MNKRRKNKKTPAKIKHTRKFTGFDNVDIELGKELGINFDEDGFPSRTRAKKELFERKNEK
ncbi:hypothetical protein [Tepidibacter formicigenes]|jgi:hypothetical protein|uniref:Uncharacterized protein n=1 Tax=Tepidibacter formicigenes DSM 15518 TaxID=1123349 RepID=A0A1M6M974_9FIRM|nr:hypothetical protein [Tepidibacter formicigenes]SHJ79910.1 hypothetical protein SAMN02744037_00859 [Tepidibacter formicigenes DSM 15518]